MFLGLARHDRLLDIVDDLLKPCTGRGTVPPAIDDFECLFQEQDSTLRGPVF